MANKLVQNENNQVVVVDNLRTGSIQKLPNSNLTNFKFIKADVNNFIEIEKIMKEIDFQYIFHYAALVGVQRTLDNPLDVLNDIEGFKNILELSKMSSVKKIFFSSSSEVYGEPVEFPQNEITTPLNAKLPYAIVKNVGEAYLKSYFKMFGLKYTIFRFFNTYGPAQSKDFVIKKFITQALSNEDLTIYGDGSQTRTFCFIDDNIDVTCEIFEKNLMDNEILNIGNTNETSVLELANLIIRLTNSNSKIIHLPALEEGDMTRRLPDNTIMKKIINRKLLSLEDGILKIINN